MKVAGALSILFSGYLFGMYSPINNENKKIVGISLLICLAITFLIPMIAALIALPLKNEK